jgi:uncharacterized membrane protein
MAQNGSNSLLLALAIIGAIALVLVLGSGLFHWSMMGGGMGGMMGGGGAMWLLGLLVIVGIVAVLVLVLSRSNRSA